MKYTVGETAEKMGLSASTLRYYEKEGILPFVERTNGNIRLFSEKDFESLRLVECLKKSGMSIKDIKTFMDWCIEGDNTISKRLDLIKRKKEEVLLEIKDLENTLKTLNYKEWYYETALKAGTCKVHEYIKTEDIPVEFR